MREVKGSGDMVDLRDSDRLVQIPRPSGTGRTRDDRFRCIRFMDDECQTYRDCPLPARLIDLLFPAWWPKICAFGHYEFLNRVHDGNLGLRRVASAEVSSTIHEPVADQAQTTQPPDKSRIACAAEPEVAGGAVRGVACACSVPVAIAVRGVAQVRAALHDA